MRECRSRFTRASRLRYISAAQAGRWKCRTASACAVAVNRACKEQGREGEESDDAEDGDHGDAADVDAEADADNGYDDEGEDIRCKATSYTQAVDRWLIKRSNLHGHAEVYMNMNMCVCIPPARI